MSKSSRKAVIITMGDPSGIGAEVAAKALLATRLPKGIDPIIIGNQEIFRQYWPSSKPMPLFIHMSAQNNTRHTPGKPTPASGRDSLLYLEKAVELIRDQRAQALVTAPVSKESILRFVPGFKGHTTWLANAFDMKNVEMLFVADGLNLVLVTRHIALKEVSRRITEKKVSDVVRASHSFLTGSLGIPKPRIAILGLNPHAGEGGHIGREEIVHIIPAMNALRASGIDLHGPFPADTFFEPRNCRGYDLVVSMYHDQALPVLKARYFDRLVNLTIGLPFIRTSPVHGTAFGIAGKGIADAGSMQAAIRLAASL